MRIRLLLLAACLCAGCNTLPEGQRSTKPASGPAEVELPTVERHALQFDEEEPVRLAGSQEELAASAYIVAHLTRAGYVSRLDAVPVQDLVRSTNVVALPPSGAEPEVLVVAGYDSARASDRYGLDIGVWLEVARALRALQEDHDVQFVALGAERTEIEGGHLGSRRLARELVDEGRSPRVFVVEYVEEGDGVAVAGAEATALAREARRLGIDVAASGRFPAGIGGVFDAAGFDATTVGGAPEDAGAVLLSYLAAL